MTEAKALAERLTEWAGPTGRKLTPGTQFKIRDKRGTWVFIAYVDHPEHPYVECKDAGTATRSPKAGIRCFRSELVYAVSNDKGGSGR